MFGWLRGLFGGGSRREPARAFHSSVAGTSHRNRDRSSRKEIILEDLSRGDVLTVRFEDNNRFDRNAVALLALSGRQVGYADSHLAAEIRQWTSEGCEVRLTTTDITGGTKEKPNVGVNFLVEVFEPEEAASGAAATDDHVSRERNT